MANEKKDKNANQTNSSLDNNTLLENIKAYELENKALKEQVAKLNQSLSELNNSQEDIAQLKEQLSTLQKNKNDLEEAINQVTNERDDLAKQLQETSKDTASKITTQSDEITQLKEELQEANKKNAEISERFDSLNVMYDKLKEDASKDKGYILSPFAKALVELLSVKLTKKYNKKVTPTHIIEDYIIRYNFSEQWTEWFHPFILTKEDILKAAQQINSNIKSYKDVKKALNL